MRRNNGLFELIVDLDNILLACIKAFKGKNNTDEVFRYKSDLVNYAQKIRSQLISGHIRCENYRQFRIYEPKERLITAPNLNQRIIQHCIMNVCHGCFERKYIYHSYASRPKKGVQAAVSAVLKASMNTGYYLKRDFRKYFDSIDHNILKVQLSRIFKDNRLLYLLYDIIDSYEVTPSKGLPIGNLTSQYFANLYLTNLDHHMLEREKMKYYFRYMDDVVILGKSQDALKRAFDVYDSISGDALKLQLKQPVYGSIREGLIFLGYRISSKGVTLSGESKRRLRKKLRLTHELYEKGIISEKEKAAKEQSIVAFAAKAQSFNLIRSCIID